MFPRHHVPVPRSSSAATPAAGAPWSLLAAASALAGLAACTSVDPLPATGEVWTEPLRSEIGSEEYVLRIRVPPGYDGGDTAYPLVVQLDPTFAGLRQFDVTVGLVSQRAADGEWPEAIVVGVDYPDPTTRERDYALPDPLDPEYGSDGADRFYRVLRDEVLPHVESSLRVDSAERVLMGHSNGGVFAWYAALRHDPAEPPLFSGIVAADNGYSEELFTLERWHAERSTSLPIRLFATRALYNGASQQVAQGFMIDRLAERDYAGLVFDAAVYETDHAGVLEPSYEDGLDHVWGGAP